MSYAIAIAAIKTLLIAGPLDLKTGDVSDEGNYDLFNASHAKGVVILDYLSMGSERAEIGASFYHDWRIQAMLAVMYTAPIQAHADMAALRQELLDVVGATPRLGIAGSLYVAQSFDGQAAPERLITEAGIAWSVETMIIEVRELHEY